MIIPKLYSRKFIKLYLVYLAEVPQMLKIAWGLLC